jgi:hypothetical protein
MFSREEQAEPTAKQLYSSDRPVDSGGLDDMERSSLVAVRWRQGIMQGLSYFMANEGCRHMQMPKTRTDKSDREKGRE